MNKVLATALAFAAVATVASAQQADQITPEKRFTIDAATVKPGPAIAPGAQLMVLPADTTIEYFWNSWVLRRVGEDNNDSGRIDPIIPRSFNQPPGEPPVEFRGVGQVFSPGILYQTYYPSIYNASSGRIQFNDPDVNDSVYIAQFKDAKDFTIDSLQFFVYKNLNAGALTLAGGKFKVWRTNYNFNSNQYKSVGINWALNDSKLMGFPEQPFNLDITPEMLEATAEENPDNPGNFRLFATMVRFDPALEFGAGESALALYYNDEANAITNVSQQQTEEWQQVIASLEYRRGDFGDSLNPLSSPMDGTNSAKSFGVVMYRYPEGQGTKDTIHSAFDHLFYTVRSTLPAIRARMNMNMGFFGSVHLSSGVTWHYGYDAKKQGLGSVAPNPVSSRATVPFSVVKYSNVTISLFDMNGREVQSLVNETLVPGKYSYEVDAANLLNGVYVVRMVAGDNVYTTKFNVSK